MIFALRVGGCTKLICIVTWVVCYKRPLVLLVDRFSASASEIFALSIQDYGWGIVVKELILGKGTVQKYCGLNRIYDQMLSPAWARLGVIQYTIQKFHRVNSGSTQHQGALPGIIIPTGTESIETSKRCKNNSR
ncbi:S41 family peptidase [Candidatus Steffania adelgidicola]|uniref:S41 family peptidase n=1 Tax=Candidatus Steffania adelgidicola TaxID=1076626 RepID=UPI001D011524|nr:S41 family peptidase [Candidatus Steffania adelgidicola]